MSFRNFVKAVIIINLVVVFMLAAGLFMGWSKVEAGNGSCGPNVTKSQPPQNIRVNYRGHIYTVPFKRYVKQVMSTGEWPHFYPKQALKAGALAVKQYAWYHVANPRYGTGSGCFHVFADTRDQMWWPGVSIYAIHHKVVNQTWGYRMQKFRKTGWKFFATGYRSDVARTGWHLSAHRANRMARNGRGWKYILKWHYRAAYMQQW